MLITLTVQNRKAKLPSFGKDAWSSSYLRYRVLQNHQFGTITKVGARWHTIFTKQKDDHLFSFYLIVQRPCLLLLSTLLLTVTIATMAVPWTLAMTTTCSPATLISLWISLLRNLGADTALTLVPEMCRTDRVIIPVTFTSFRFHPPRPADRPLKKITNTIWNPFRTLFRPRLFRPSMILNTTNTTRPRSL